MKASNEVPDFRALSISVAFIFLLAALRVTAGGTAENATSADYQERPPLETSLFPSDKAVLGEEAIQKILTSKFVLPKTVKIAVFKIPEVLQQAIKYYGYGYWRSEEYLKTQQRFMDTLSAELSKSPIVDEVATLPGLLTPKEPTIALMRETSVRLQADMLMVFKLSSDVYQKYRFLQSSQAKAYATCEGFLLDVRTGLIPMSRIVTKEFLATRETKDASFSETMARAENEASMLSLSGFGSAVAEFLDAVAKAAGSE